MKRFILFLMMIGTANIQMFAVPQLPADRKCVVAKPSILWKKTIRESEIQSFLNSGNWGQKHTVNKYWTVYSDRSHNITYNASSTSSGKYDELDFNEQIRIAQIENDFALVYTEKKKGVLYPLISEDAVCRGWIPMKNLLLWDSCPTDEKGIYNKALIVLNIDELRKGNTDLGKMYNNPATKDNPHRVVSDMEFYFVMKKSDNGLVLLSRECRMEGYTSSVLYGWVSSDSFFSWNGRVCLEPNWKPAVAEQLKGESVDILNNEGTRITSVKLGRENGITTNATTKYRMDPHIMRYPLLGNESETQYRILAGVRLDGMLSISNGYDDISIEALEMAGIITKEQIEKLKKNYGFLVFQGVTKKKSDSDLDYWQPIICISSDEFAQMMEKLLPVMDAANIGERKPYIEAIKALVRSMLPGITQKEMDEMSVSEVMALVSGVTIKTQSMSNRTLAQIKDEKVVKRDEFDGLIANFKNKYNRLRKIRENKYDFSVQRNKTTWYWLPVEDLP